VEWGCLWVVRSCKGRAGLGSIRDGVCLQAYELVCYPNSTSLLCFCDAGVVGLSLRTFRIISFTVC
jgi:hypothetical protein